MVLLLSTKFQFLIGRLETSSESDPTSSKSRLNRSTRGMTVSASPRVSIPYRYVRNEVDLLWNSAEVPVSIPYRYVRNGKEIAFTRQLQGFQFLIGTLETINSHDVFPYRRLFQFLIGTLETFSSPGRSP